MKLRLRRAAHETRRALNENEIEERARILEKAQILAQLGIGPIETTTLTAYSGRTDVDASQLVKTPGVKKAMKQLRGLMNPPEPEPAGDIPLVR